MSLETMFNQEINKKQTQSEKYILGLKKNWDKALEGAKETYEKLSFLKDKGYKVKIEHNTEFILSDAQQSYYPNVRVNDTIKISNWNLGSGIIGVSSLGKFPLMGESHTYESFVKKLIK